MRQVAVAIIAFALMLGCGESDNQTSKIEQRQKTTDDAAREQCIKQGGIPISSIWDSRLANCIFPPKETK